MLKIIKKVISALGYKLIEKKLYKNSINLEILIPSILFISNSFSDSIYPYPTSGYEGITPKVTKRLLLE